MLPDVNSHKETTPLTPLLLAVCLVLLIVPASMFMPVQSLWVDETTQLSGLTLGPVEVVAWLAGGEHPFDVPPDRMPPLSYWAGMVWAAIFGLSEMTMRWLALLLIAASVVLVFMAGRRAFGWLGGLAAGAVYASSPNVIEHAVNIRAYPLFLLFTAGALYCVVAVMQSPAERRSRWLVLLGACLCGSIYTHFYGVILAGACLAAMFIVTVRSDRFPARRLLYLLCAVGVLSVGVLPFVFASTSMSATGEPSSGIIRDMVRLAYRLPVHPSMVPFSGAVAAALLATAVFVGASMLNRSSARGTGLTILLTLCCGSAAVFAGRVVVKSFSVASPLYNVWMLPFFAMLAGAAIAGSPKRLHRLAAACVLIMVAANAYGSIQLATNGKHFARVPSQEVAALVREYEPGSLALIYEDSGGCGHVYFP